MVATTRNKTKEKAWSVFRSFPPEVLAMVIEQLSDDKASLSACCLVSHYWLSIGQPCLFRRAKVCSTKDGPDIFDTFSRFLQRSGIGIHIRRLTLTAPPLDFDPAVVVPLDENADYLVSEYCAPCSIDLVLGILGQTNRLRHLNLHLLKFNASSSYPENIPPPNSTLDYLSIQDCTAVQEDVKLFYDIICVFADIGTLSFTCGPWAEAIPAGALFSERSRLPLIHKLDMYGDYDATTNGTLELLRRSGSLDGALTEIEFDTTVEVIAIRFMVFLPEAATHLVYLNLQTFCAFCDHSFDRPFPFRFPFFPALRRLSLDMDLDIDIDVPTCSVYIGNIVNVYAQLLSASSSFPVLYRLDFPIAHGVLAPAVFNYSASLVAAWPRLGEALVALPAITSINFELADVPADQRGMLDPIVDWRIGDKMDNFFRLHVPALYAKPRLYHLLHDREAAGYESDSDTKENHAALAEEG